MNTTKLFAISAAVFLLLGLARATSAAIIGHWAFDETAGTIAADSSSGGNNGILQGGLRFDFDADPNSFGSVPGVFGNALRGFSGTEYVDVGDVLNPGTNDYSVTLWFKPHSNPGLGMIINKGNLLSNNPGYNIKQSGATRFEARNSTGTSDKRRRYRTDGLGSVVLDTWYHLAMTMDHNPAIPDPNEPGNEWTFRAYLDGVEFPTKNINEDQQGPIRNTQSLRFGRRNDNSDGAGIGAADGDLDDVGIFDQVLTQSDILNIMNNGVASFATPGCDFDGSGCGLSDINLLMAQGDLTAGVAAGAGNQFDLNNDNTINELDIGEWLGLAGTSRGYASGSLRGDTDDLDIDFDLNSSTRTVDITDFQNFLGGFTGAGSTWEVGNFNGDNIVDITDFSNHFLPNFAATNGGSYGPGQAIPEPSTIVLLVLGGVVLAGLVRRGKLAGSG